MAFLKKHGLKRIAEQLTEELELEDESDLNLATRQQLDKLSWLRGVPKTKVLALCRQAKEDASPPSRDDAR